MTKRSKVDESQRVRPEELQAGDVEKNKNETGRMVKEVRPLTLPPSLPPSLCAPRADSRPAVMRN